MMMIDDAQDRAAMVRYNGADYFYVYNLQGDVVAYGADYGTGIPENGGKDYQFAGSFAPGISTVIELESAS